MKGRETIIWVGLVSFWLFFILEFATDIWFGSKFPGYNWKAESMSYLGQSGSPIEHLVSLWGITFSVLLSLFVIAFSRVYISNKWLKLAAFSLLIYALGEGIGSGCFPINPPNTAITLDGKLHNVFSGIGDTGIVLLPFWLMLMFPRNENRKLYTYLWTVVGIGLVMATFFLIAKYYQPDNFVLHYKGVWQRIYTANYDVMMLVVSLKMLREKDKG